MGKGKFISFEGVDGAGKTTQIDLLKSWLEAQSIAHVMTREPGGTLLGTKIRRLLFDHPGISMMPLTEAFLFQADRAQHFAEVVLPSLAEGKLVVTDRCLDSNLVYQGLQGVDMAFIHSMSTEAAQDTLPDLVILLDLPSEEVHKRKSAGQEITRFDRESLQFHARARLSFLSLAGSDKESFAVIDASKGVQDIHEEIVLLVQALLEKE